MQLSNNNFFDHKGFYSCFTRVWLIFVKVQLWFMIHERDGDERPLRLSLKALRTAAGRPPPRACQANRYTPTNPHPYPPAGQTKALHRPQGIQAMAPGAAGRHRVGRVGG